MTFFASRRSSAASVGGDALHLACRLRSGGGGRALLGTEAAEDDAQERAIHRPAHDVAQDRAARPDQRAGDDEQIVGQHEAGRRGRPARIAVEHRHDDRHVGSADRHHQVDAQDRRQHRAQDERHRLADARWPPRRRRTAWPGTTHARIITMFKACRPGKQQRLAADDALELAERDHRTGEGDGSDEHPDEDLDLVDARLGAGQAGWRVRTPRRSPPARPRRRRSCGGWPRAVASPSSRRGRRAWRRCRRRLRACPPSARSW